METNIECTEQSASDPTATQAHEILADMMDDSMLLREMMLKRKATAQDAPQPMADDILQDNIKTPEDIFCIVKPEDVEPIPTRPTLSPALKNLMEKSEQPSRQVFSMGDELDRLLTSASIRTLPGARHDSPAPEQVHVPTHTSAQVTTIEHELQKVRVKYPHVYMYLVALESAAKK